MGEVSLIDVSKRFTLRVDGEVQTVQALDRVSFTVRDGEIVALIGPSGCGKTTALRIAMGLEAATGGRVTVDGREVKGCGYDRGMVFQHAELLPWLTAMQNVMFGLEMKGVRGSALRDTAMKYLDLVGLDGHAQPPAASALGRHAAARRHRPRARHRPQGAADGRAVRRARCADARDAAGRAARDPRAAPERPSCSSPTISTRRCCSPTASWSCARAGCRRSSTCRCRGRAAISATIRGPTLRGDALSHLAGAARRADDAGAD